jgi:hypothetical protein
MRNQTLATDTNCLKSSKMEEKSIGKFNLEPENDHDQLASDMDSVT